MPRSLRRRSNSFAITSKSARADSTREVLGEDKSGRVTSCNSGCAILPQVYTILQDVKAPRERGGLPEIGGVPQKSILSSPVCLKTKEHKELKTKQVLYYT